MMSRRGFGNITLAVFCLGIFAAALSLFRSRLGDAAGAERAVLFWSLVCVVLVLNLFYGAVALLRRRGGYE